jgi:HlyD family secretion protein
MEPAGEVSAVYARIEGVMSRKSILLLTLLSVACAAAYLAALGPGSASEPVEFTTPARRALVAPGTVEPISEEIDVASEVTGKLAQVLVEEGGRIQAGQVVAIVANRDYQSQVASARATLDERMASLRRLVNGARVQERLEARAGVEETDAVVTRALAVRDRRRDLFEKGAIAREEVERADEAWSIAVAKQHAASERYALVDADAREEDRAQAEAAVAVARAAVDEAEAVLAKTYIRSPIDGVVLRRHRHPGETVLNSASDPIVTVGDISRLRVRAEIDELDVAVVRSGQLAVVRADAYPDRAFAGTVARVGEALGKKRIRTELPEERMDAKVLEVLVQLENPAGLRPGLRVDVFIEPGDGDASY